MILSFIDIRKVPREMLKTEGEHLPRDLANVNEWKIMFDPHIENYISQEQIFINITMNLRPHASSFREIFKHAVNAQYQYER